MILPYIDQSPLYDKINFSAPMYNDGGADPNFPPGPQMFGRESIPAREIPAFMCPSDGQFGGNKLVSHGLSVTNYAGSMGWDWWWHGGGIHSGIFRNAGLAWSP